MDFTDLVAGFIDSVGFTTGSTAGNTSEAASVNSVSTTALFAFASAIS